MTLTDLDLTRALLFVSPAAVIALFRSFAIRGSFPVLGAESIGVIVIGAAIYTLCLRIIGLDISERAVFESIGSVCWFLLLVVLPAIMGFGIGLIEANDFVGRALRRLNVRLPSPDRTAWETLFRELPPQSILQVTTENGGQIIGRWISSSASSNEEGHRDLFIDEIGSIQADEYVPSEPKRGVYIHGSNIWSIEVIKMAKGGTNDAE